jgi:xylulokinase
MGGAMLAMVACGAYANVEEAAASIVRIVDTIEPDPELVEKYNARYDQFRRIYPAVKELFGQIG